MAAMRAGTKLCATGSATIASLAGVPDNNNGPMSVRAAPPGEAGRAHQDAAGASRPAQASWDYVATSDLDRAPLHVALSPLPTVLTILRDALQGGRRGIPAQWREASVSRLRARDAAVLAPLSDPRVVSYPSLLEPVDTRARRETFDAALERLSDVAGDALVRALETERDVTAVPAWDEVKRAPGRWLAHYVDALRRCWSELEPLWRRSSALLEREQDSLISTLDRGVAPTEIMTTRCSRMLLRDGAVRLAPADGESRQVRIDPHGVTVIPMVVSAQAGTLSAPGDYLDWIGYPLPDGWRAFDDSAPPAASLQALLGMTRSALLRSLDHPRPVGELAQMLSCAPSAITFQLRALEAAGLISRQRDGRRVFVHRTSRATALLALYEVP
jgi:DNA-binding transcriptional ArsR family regulator